MKKLLRTFLFSLFALWFVPQVMGGFQLEGDGQTYLAGAAVLAFIYIFIKPLLKLFFLPINFLSLGLLSWLVNVAVLYLLTMIVPQVRIAAWSFPGLAYQGFTVPAYHLNQTANFILVSFVLSFIVNFLSWISK